MQKEKKRAYAYKNKFAPPYPIHPNPLLPSKYLKIDEGGF